MTELITVRQLAQLLKISTSALYKHAIGIKHCDLLYDLPQPALRGRRTLWVEADIQDWLESRRTFKPAQTAAQPEPAEPPRRPRSRPRKYSAAAGGEGGTK
jgi:predicted DNA-binding transcriptional regulator AlpA